MNDIIDDEYISIKDIEKVLNVARSTAYRLKALSDFLKPLNLNKIKKRLNKIKKSLTLYLFFYIIDTRKGQKATFIIKREISK